MKASFKKSYASLGADKLVLLWLGVWWIANLVQAGFTELANDEAYYHMFAERLAWGYFDHPPVTALLVWAGERLFGGELGVRFFFTVLQPLYLWILWRLIRPADAGRCDAGLFVVLSAATLMLQLYGFIAVPDGPLMFTTALFLLTFRWFSGGCRPGMAVDGRRHGADGLQQIPRRAGGSLRAGRQPAATVAPGPVFKRRGGVAAARSAPRVAVRARLGVVRLPSFGPQFGLQTRLRRRIPGQHAGGLQPFFVPLYVPQGGK